MFMVHYCKQLVQTIVFCHLHIFTSFHFNFYNNPLRAFRGKNAFTAVRMVILFALSLARHAIFSYSVLCSSQAIDHKFLWFIA